MARALASSHPTAKVRPRLDRPLGRRLCLARWLKRRSNLTRRLKYGLRLTRQLGPELRLARPLRENQAPDWSARPRGEPALSLTTTGVGCGPRAMPVMPGRGQTHLNATRGRDRPYMGTHVTNSARRTDTVLPNPCAAPVKGKC
jgi:hypothetical protein